VSLGGAHKGAADRGSGSASGKGAGGAAGGEVVVRSGAEDQCEWDLGRGRRAECVGLV